MFCEWVIIVFTLFTSCDHEGDPLHLLFRVLARCSYAGLRTYVYLRKEGAPMAKIIAIVNQKGGVGKTTTCVNLAACLTEEGARVLVCDFDPQGNATSGLGVYKNDVPHTVYDLIVTELNPEEAIVHTPYAHVLPSNKSLAGASIELIGMPEREYLLKHVLQKVEDRYDFILIDCPPSLELLTLNCLCAADSIIVPVQCEYYALEGLSDLLTTVRIVKRSLNPSIELEGVVLTMYDGRTNFSLQVAEEVKRHFPGKTFATVIPRNVRIAEAPSHGKPVNVYDSTSRGTDAYRRFTREVLIQNPLPKKDEPTGPAPEALTPAEQ